MRRMAFIVLAVALFALAAFGQEAWAAGPFIIACEGMESGGGGVTRYQYTLQNVGGVPELLTDLYVGTQDPNPADYTFLPTLPPLPFLATVSPNGVPFAAVTDNVKTAHGVVPPGPWSPCAGLVRWNAPGGVVVPPMGTITFRFDHPGNSQDVEWRALSIPGVPGGVTVPSPFLPIGGPLGMYTQGYVHGPTPVTPATSNWSLAALAGLLLAVPVWLLLRRRRSVVGTA